MNTKSLYNSPLFDDEEDEKKQKAPEQFSEKFLKTRQIILTGEINKELADSIVRQLLILDSEDEKSPIYMYIDSFRNFNNVGIALSNKFTVLYDSKEQNISIIKKPNHINIYPSNIQNISAIVGKNSVGKTNLLDLIGMKIDDRNKNNAENKITYEMDPDTGLRNRFVKEEKFAKYFMKILYLYDIISK